MEQGVIILSLVHIVIGLLLVLKDRSILKTINDVISPHLRVKGNKAHRVRSIMRLIGWILIILGLIWLFLLDWISDITGGWLV